MAKEPRIVQMTDLKDVLYVVSEIARIKDRFPAPLKGYVAELDLHVQKRSAGEWTRLQAGGKYRSYLDAFQKWSPIADFDTADGDISSWDIRKCDSDT
jgi:hypothetical protein